VLSAGDANCRGLAGDLGVAILGIPDVDDEVYDEAVYDDDVYEVVVLTVLGIPDVGLAADADAGAAAGAACAMLGLAVSCLIRR
jgi:hypothetical protein